MTTELDEFLKNITPLNREAMEAARRYQASLAKPPESLGRLEELSIQLAGITGKLHNTMDHPHLLVFAADNGVAEEGVSSAPQSVTLMQTINLTRGKTGASTLCKHFGVGITVCDVGVKADIHEPAVLNRKIAYGTRNMAKEPAMTREQATRAILTGIGLAMRTEASALGVGEMGIGNTTTSAAVLSVLLDAPVEQVTGRGGGITDEAFQKKKEVISRAIAINKPDKTDVVVFSEYRTRVENEFSKLSKEILLKLQAIEDKIGSDNPELYSQALTTCRRLFEETAKELFEKYFPGYEEKKYKTKSGKEIDVSGEHYKNKLSAVIEKLEDKSPSKSMVGSNVIYLLDWMDNLTDLQCKGVHHEVTRH